MKRCSSFARADKAAGAAEFALVLPIFLLMLLGIIDIGGYMWTLNQAEKATQMGARYAVVNNPVAMLLRDNFNEEHGEAAGDPVPTDTFNTATCTATDEDTATCTVVGNLASENAADAAAFSNIVNRMKSFYASVDYPNVRITYKNVGLGFAGDPNGPNVAALTTVEVRDLTFQPLVLFGGSIDLPPVKAMLTLEDAECSEDDGNATNGVEESNCDYSN